MPALERRISPRGPRFWREGRVLMFCNQIDNSTRDGPRPATDEDEAAHPDAFADLGRESADPPGLPLVTVKDPAIIPAPAPRPYAAKRDKTREQFAG